MDTSLLTSLTSLETALTSLTESITTASLNLPQSSTHLLAADTQLTTSLQHLKQHTENILLLTHLHSLAAHLAETYKHQIKHISDLRSEILRVNISGPPPPPPSSLAVAAAAGGPNGAKQQQQGDGEQEQVGDRNEQQQQQQRENTVDYKTLLAFARSVSHYTAPRGFKTPSVLRAEAEAKSSEARPELGMKLEDEAARNEGVGAGAGAGTGAVATNGSEPLVVNGLLQNDQADILLAQHGRQQQVAAAQEDRNPGIESLAPDVKAWLDPQLQVPFLPWPSEEMVARSGLARVSGWVGAVGVEDDAGVAEQAREAEEEALRRKDEEQKAAAARYDDYEQQQVRSAPKPKVFTGLDLYDPDEE